MGLSRRFASIRPQKTMPETFFQRGKLVQKLNKPGQENR
jgi:hypothetical protein